VARGPQPVAMTLMVNGRPHALSLEPRGSQLTASVGSAVKLAALDARAQVTNLAIAA